MRAVAGDKVVASRRDDGRDERSRNGSEIDIEIFDLARPMAPKHGFDAAADSPSDCDGAVADAPSHRHESGPISALRADNVDTADCVGHVHMAISQSTGHVRESLRRYGGTDTTTKRAKPVQFLA